MNKARIARAGTIPFAKPEHSEDWDVMAEQAISCETQRRQVEDMRFGLQHNIGRSGARVVTLSGRAA